MINLQEQIVFFTTQFNDQAFTDGAGFTPLALSLFIVGIFVALMFLFGALSIVVGAFSAILSGASLRSALVTAVVVFVAIAIISVILNIF